MLIIFARLVRMFVNLCLSMLPASPFQGFVLPELVETGLGWLNWLVPIGDMLGLLELWLLAAAAWMLYRYLYRQLGGIRKALLG